ncbi:nitrile hydratase subunit beta [Jhaorihella thermophila]|uniref:Nitrile hydratase subunit beta n=1 Tax=Jhaorihella thermophila TaxID=488547 RepID=A0A1H5VYA1_9RHOB|nr:nitrile hydratase subunit beta [Jhaorihella thermophila]SEF92190.1 nitrile hydratase [Jhaorihella thermophila]
MTRIHDMGGRFGHGPVEPGQPDDPVFAQDWHGRALAVTLAAGALGQWNIDMSRHARERLCPRDYVNFSYYEKWLAGLADLLVETGVLTRDDLRGEGDDAPHPLAARRLRAEAVAGVLARGGPADRPCPAEPAFIVGQAVRAMRPAANRLVDGGHTRLPAYAAGALGYVHRVHGCHVLPDSNAHGLGEAPEPLYSVRFRAGQLWAAPEHPDDEVFLDLWQSYLVPA